MIKSCGVNFKASYDRRVQHELIQAKAGAATLNHNHSSWQGCKFGLFSYAKSHVDRIKYACRIYHCFGLI